MRRYAVMASLAILLLAWSGVTWAQQAPQLLRNQVRPEITRGAAPMVGPLPTAQRMNLSIVLPLRNEDDLKSLLARLYDPSSPDYRHFLSVEEFTARYGPTADDYQAVVNFAKANGLIVTGTAANRLVVPISGDVDQVQRAFNVRMNTYQHPTENRTFFSPDREPSLNLNVPVAHISGLNNFSLPRPLVVSPQPEAFLANPAATFTGSGPLGNYLASDMRAAYYGGSTLDGTGQTVGLFELDGYDPSDVPLTFTSVGQSYNVPVNNVLLDGMTGGHVNQIPNAEAEVVLDIVQAIGMAPGLSQVRVYIGQSDVDILNSMATENIAKQIASSWIWTGDAALYEPFFEEFAAQGQSFFQASGDDGAYSTSSYAYPAVDNYVTAVGGTTLLTDDSGGPWESESAWSNSGGGIGPNSPIPTWQNGLANSSNGGSATQRNVPDVAMEADFDNYQCSLGVCQTGWAGTSFAAPRWAGFMALINQQAVEAGNALNGGLGFLNPALYSLAEGASYSSDLHDIAIGSNKCCFNFNSYPAVPGYDLVTGWGSPNGTNLIDDLAGPQVPGFWLRPSTPSLQVGSGLSGSTTINIINAGGFTGGVNLGVSPLPTGVTASWGANPASGSSVLTLSADSDAPASTTNLTIAGTAGTFTATTTVALAVHAPTFLLTAAPSAVGIAADGTATSTILVTPQFGFASKVNLSISGLPSGVTTSFSPASTTGASTLTLTAGSTLTPGTSNLTITGTSGNLTVTTPLTLLVEEPFFTLAASSVGVNQGSTAGGSVQIHPMYGFTGSVTLSASGLPSGVTASFSPNPATTATEISVTAASNAPFGTFPVTVSGTSGSLGASTTFNLTILPPTFMIYTLPNQISVIPGDSGSARVDVSPFGFKGSASLSLSGLPPGVSSAFTQNPVYITDGSITSTQLTLTGTGAVALGNYNLTITGTSGSLSSSTTIILNVVTEKATPTVTVTPSPASITLNQGLTVTVGMSGSSGVFTGSVGLSGSGFTLSPVALNGSPSALFTIPAGTLPVGTDTLTATYSGDGNYKPATGSGSVTVNRLATSVTVSASPVSLTQEYSALLSVSVSGSPFPTGTVTVTSGGSTIGGGTLTNGSVSITVSGNALAVGTDTVTASYSGDSTYSPASGSTTVTVTAPIHGPVYPAQPAVNLGAVNLGTSSSPTAITFNSAATQNVGSTAVVTQGAQGLDFTNASGGTCDTNGSTHVYHAGDSCTVNVNFTPLYAGARHGAVRLLDTSGNILATAFLYGSGSGPQLVFPSNTSVTTLGGDLVSPASLSVDAKGNLYVSDNGVVKEIPAGCTSASCVTTLGGGFVTPRGVAVDGSGNVYVADSGNVTVSEIPLGCLSSSCVMTLGGGFNSPRYVAVDGSGNIYVSDYSNSISNGAVKEIPLGCMLASCVATLANVQYPGGVAVDGYGNVYAYDGNIHQIQSVRCISNCKTGPINTFSPILTVDGTGNFYLGAAVDGSGNTYTTSNGAVQRQNLAAPPSLSFANSAIGSQSSDSPKTVTLRNIGNAGLTFAVPGTGQNPSISGNFALDASTTCPEVTPSSPAGALAASASCTLAVDFIPTTGGSITGSVVLSDNNLNVANTTQNIGLSGTGVAATPLTPWIQVNNGGWQQTNNVTVSPGSTVNLGEQVLTGGSYSWTGPGGYTSTSRIASGVPLNSTSNVFTLTYTNTAGAASTAIFTVNLGGTTLTPWIQVNNGGWQQLSTVTASPGDTVNLGEQVLTGGSYIWTGPGGYTSTSRIASSVPLASATNVFTLAYTNTAGATSTATFTVKVGGTPLTPYVQVNNGGWQQINNLTVSPGSTVNLGEQVLPGGSYSWTGPSGFSSTSRIASNVPLNSASNVFTLTYTNTAGATSTATFTVTVGSTPLTPYIQVGNGGWRQISTVTVNAGSTVNLGEQVLTGGSYSWSGPGGYSSTSRIASNVPLNSGSNVFTLTYTNTFGATSTCTFTITAP